MDLEVDDFEWHVVAAPPWDWVAGAVPTDIDVTPAGNAGDPCSVRVRHAGPRDYAVTVQAVDAEDTVEFVVRARVPLAPVVIPSWFDPLNDQEDVLAL